MKTGFAVLIAGIWILGGLILTTPNYLYMEYEQKTLGTEKDCSELNCLMISDDDWRGFPVALRLSEFEEVIVLGEDEKSVLASEKPQGENRDLLIYVLKELDQEQNLREACEYLGYEYVGTEMITSDVEDFNAYLVEANRNE